jgi:dTDP-4-dehydrorhamnose reductase
MSGVAGTYDGSDNWGLRRRARMRILLTGKTGQVGYELERSLRGFGEIVAVDRGEMDLARLDQVRRVIRAVKPDLIVNPAAYTAVDQAESETALAMRVNAEAPAVMAEEARTLGAAMIHYSTGYVFDGRKDAPYVESDAPCPLNAYGASKLAGERAIQAAGIQHLILRTNWVYSTRGTNNFLMTMLRLAGERDELRVVGDQFGAPTWCRTVADTTAQLLLRLHRQGAARAFAGAQGEDLSGIYHLTAQGATSWHGFAEAIVRHARLAHPPVVTAIATADYPLRTPRPVNSVLSCARLQALGMILPEWQDALDRCLHDPTAGRQ